MNRKLIITLLLSLVLTACASKGGKNGDGAGDTTSGNPDGNGSAIEDNNAYDTGFSAQELRDRYGIEGNPLDYKTVFFEYNSSSIDERSRIIVGAHARAVGGAAVTLAGHADERGTRDFNLALGERRSQTVADLMSAEGANTSIQTISYGEERPADSQHNDTAWQKNRRVEIAY